VARCSLLFFALAAYGAITDDVQRTVALMAKVGSCASPSFSPDGKRLAFVSNMSGSPQIWTVATEGGWPTQVTALDDPVGFVAWSPDGKWLAFQVAPGGGMNQQVYLMHPDGTGMRRITSGGKETNGLSGWSHDGRWLAWDSNRKRPGSMDAYAYDVTTSESMTIADLQGVGGIEDFSRDRKKVVLSRLKSRGSNDLFVRDLDSGKEVLLTPHEGPGSFGIGVFSPDGSTVYISSNKDRDRMAFAKVSASGGPIQVIATRDDAELSGAQITEDGQTAVVNWNAGGRTELTFIDLKTLKATPGPKLPAELAGGLAFSRDGRLLAMTSTGSASPVNIWVFDRQTSKLWQVTDSPHAGVDLASLVRPELVRFKAHDGLELSGWLNVPRGAKKPMPMVLSFHGGPEGQEVPAFRSDYQALLAQGIGVFAPNVRGSSGFGKKFVNLDNGELRFNGVKDIQSCVDYVVKNGIADSKRLGIMGGSYGGYMVTAAITEYPEMFAAAADLFGIVNFETFFKHTEPWMAAISTIEYGDPATQADLLRRLSPIHKIDRIKTPTIVLHGANDTNVPVVEAEQVVENLKKRNIPVEYVLFPDEGHGWRKTPNRIRSTVALVQWFDKHLNSERSAGGGQ
jgi:dipeptidyl aminopeptidase/acylaminoacyl peptidase